MWISKHQALLDRSQFIEQCYNTAYVILNSMKQKDNNEHEMCATQRN